MSICHVPLELPQTREDADQLSKQLNKEVAEDNKSGEFLEELKKLTLVPTKKAVLDALSSLECTFDPRYKKLFSCFIKPFISVCYDFTSRNHPEKALLFTPQHTQRDVPCVYIVFRPFQDAIDCTVPNQDTIDEGVEGECIDGGVGDKCIDEGVGDKCIDEGVGDKCTVPITIGGIKVHGLYAGSTGCAPTRQGQWVKHNDGNVVLYILKDVTQCVEYVNMVCPGFLKGIREMGLMCFDHMLFRQDPGHVSYTQEDHAACIKEQESLIALSLVEGAFVLLHDRVTTQIVFEQLCIPCSSAHGFLKHDFLMDTSLVVPSTSSSVDPTTSMVAIPSTTPSIPSTTPSTPSITSSTPSITSSNNWSKNTISLLVLAAILDYSQEHVDGKVRGHGQEGMGTPR